MKQLFAAASSASVVIVAVGGFSARAPLDCASRSRRGASSTKIQMSEDDANGSIDDNGDGNEFLSELTQKYLNVKPSMPSMDSISRPSKSDLYDEDELSRLFEIHQEISPATQKTNDEPPSFDDMGDDFLPPSLHDLVLSTIDDIDASSPTTPTTATGIQGLEVDTTIYPWLTAEIREKMQAITAIATDVDGTLTTSQQTIHPRTAQGVSSAVEAVVSPDNKLQYFFPATGKTRAGAMNSLGKELAEKVSQCSAGVFIQGLYCLLGDEIIFEKKLPNDAIVECEKLVKESETSIIAYDGDNLYTNDKDDVVKELSTKYGEPKAIEIPSLADHENGIHKILVCHHDLDKLARVRVKLERLAEQTNCCVTQAVPTMLELLPQGCSKALGVEKLCQALGIDPSTQLLAIGDAENDVGMLEMAAIGVAVGNAGDLAREAADIVLEETNDDGGAGLAMEVLGGI